MGELAHFKDIQNPCLFDVVAFILQIYKNVCVVRFWSFFSSFWLVAGKNVLLTKN